MPKHNFPDISRGEHDKGGTAYLKYTNKKKTIVCKFTLWVNEGFLISSKTFFSCCKNRNLRRSKIILFRKTITILVKKLILQNPLFTQSVKVQTTVFFLFCVFQISSSFFIMLTARDVGKIVFWHNGLSDSSYKYFLLKKFIKNLMTCKNK